VVIYIKPDIRKQEFAEDQMNGLKLIDRVAILAKHHLAILYQHKRLMHMIDRAVF